MVAYNPQSHWTTVSDTEPETDRGPKWTQNQGNLQLNVWWYPAWLDGRDIGSYHFDIGVFICEIATDELASNGPFLSHADIHRPDTCTRAYIKNRLHKSQPYSFNCKESQTLISSLTGAK